MRQAEVEVHRRRGDDLDPGLASVALAEDVKGGIPEADAGAIGRAR
ncbi:MAG: hypothetical protein V9G19_23850 [Tetrasphaera sp.]